MLRDWLGRADRDPTCWVPEEEAADDSAVPPAEDAEPLEVVTRLVASASVEDCTPLSDPFVEEDRTSEWLTFACVTFARSTLVRWTLVWWLLVAWVFAWLT
ncbi:MAG TPA: hypothetical protein VFF52_26955 [Isosphaeraceae bacterium]|nr:hypothetical protein [Isosphaeraceae bacterium]